MQTNRNRPIKQNSWCWETNGHATCVWKGSYHCFWHGPVICKWLRHSNYPPKASFQFSSIWNKSGLRSHSGDDLKALLNWARRQLHLKIAPGDHHSSDTVNLHGRKVSAFITKSPLSHGDCVLFCEEIQVRKEGENSKSEEVPVMWILTHLMKNNLMWEHSFTTTATRIMDLQGVTHRTSGNL